MVPLESSDVLHAQADLRGLSLGLGSNAKMKHGSFRTRTENHCFLVARKVVRVRVRES